MDKKFNWFKSVHSGRMTCRMPSKYVPAMFPVGLHGVESHTATLELKMEIYSSGGVVFIPSVEILNISFSGKEFSSEAEAIAWCEENVEKLATEVVNAAGRIKAMIENALNGEEAEVAEWEGC